MTSLKSFLRSSWVPLLLMIVLVVLIGLPVLTYPMGRDQGMYANIGRTILAGGTPFVDMWDIKPPPIYYLYAMVIGIFGATVEAVHALNLIGVPLAMLGLFMVGRQLERPRVGWLAALLFGAFYFNDGFQNISQSDSLATIPAIWAAYWTIRAARLQARSQQAMLAAVIVGMLCGILLWFKPQQYALVVLAFVIYQIVSRWRTTDAAIPAILSDAAAFAIGGVLTGGTLLAYFWAQGMVQEILIVAETTRSYNAQGYDPVAFVQNMTQGLWFRWQVWHGLFVLSGVWLVLASVRLLRGASQGRESLLWLLWLLSGLGFAMVQAKGFDTHWFPMLPPMAIMGALVLDWSLGQIAHHSTQHSVIISNIVIIGAILAIPTVTTWGTAWPYLVGQQSRYDYWDTFQANDLKPEQSLAMAQYLRERVQAGDTLYIYGFRPEVYFLADLRPATRYQAHFPLIAPWYPTEWQQQNVDVLWAAMPPYTLILEDDFMPWVTNFDADSHTLLQDDTELNNWLIANYHREDEIGDFIIWKRAQP